MTQEGGQVLQNSGIPPRGPYGKREEKEVSDNPAETAMEKLPELARVTLVTGKNGSGKTRFLRKAAGADGVSPGRPAPHLHLGPEAVSPERLVELWDRAGPGRARENAKAALREVSGQPVSSVRKRRRPYLPTWLGASITGQTTNAVSIDALGTGAAWAFAVHLALGCAQHRVLTIDGIEHGLHHSLLEGLWTEILRTSRKKDVRIAATTHSWDAIAALARAAAAERDQDVMLVRLERGAGTASPVTYSGDELLTAARQGIEVR